MRPLNRAQPAGPAHAYKTFAVSAPRSTHYTPATCNEVECKAQAFGWQTFINESETLGQGQAHYIRHESGRAYVEDRNEHGVTVFTFGAGQDCFTTHERPLDREEFFTTRRGDWRPERFGSTVTYDRADQWVSDFKDHQDRLASRQ